MPISEHHQGAGNQREHRYNAQNATKHPPGHTRGEHAATPDQLASTTCAQSAVVAASNIAPHPSTPTRRPRTPTPHHRTPPSPPSGRRTAHKYTKRRQPAATPSTHSPTPQPNRLHTAHTNTAPPPRTRKHRTPPPPTPTPHQTTPTDTTAPIPRMPSPAHHKPSSHAIRLWTRRRNSGVAIQHDLCAPTVSVWATNTDSSMLHPSRPTHGLPMNFVELTLSKDDPWFSNPATR